MVTFNQIVPVLQVATGPVILISGVGLLLLTMTNRLGRVIDRARQLCQQAEKTDAEKRIQILEQIDVIYLRGKVIRLSIGLAGFCVLLVSALIILLFISALMDWQTGVLVVLIFIISIASLFGSLVAFLYDINLALNALRLELKTVKPDIQ